MKETEITAEVFNSLEEINSKLVKNGYNLIEKYKLVDYYFSKYSLSALKKFSYKRLISSSFLFREVLSKKKRFFLEYKQKKIDKSGRVVSEEKFDAETYDLSTLEIFKKAGLTNWCILSDTLYIYRKGEVEFAIQEVDGLGIFIEIEELESMKSMSEEEKLSSLKKIAKGLGLKLSNDFSCKKPLMLFKKQFSE